MAERLVLDTCGLLFLASGDRRLSSQARNRIATAATVSVVAITGFEIALKVGQGKLRLPCPTDEWLAGVIEEYHLQKIPLDLDLCRQAAELAPIHRDPCDRFIIAAAQLIRAAVVTVDPIFSEYGLEGVD